MSMLGITFIDGHLYFVKDNLNKHLFLISAGFTICLFLFFRNERFDGF